MGALLVGISIIYGCIRFRYRDTYKPTNKKLIKTDRSKDGSGKR